ncbi:hypothetical protein [Streptomyces sp. NPDC059071]|uniref:hypothetical protein n=1 Tax=unclassified Streptomyces TaxID=2593676 RepID=UPI003649526C
MEPAQELAFTLQAMYMAQGQSLADPATASSFQTALSAVLLMVDGAHAQDLVDDEQWHTLRGMFEEMQQAPQLV